MAIAGSWRNGAVTAASYAGATRWGTGINPVHAIRDEGPGRGPTKEPLGSTGPSDAVDTSLTDTALYGYEGEDTQFYIGEDYRYLQEDHPNWGEGSAGRPDRGEAIFDAGVLPGPAGFPSWGPHWDDNEIDGFPLPGPSGGGRLRSVSQGTDVESLRAIAVPTHGYTGGWLNKEHGEITDPGVSDPSQLTINTGGVQLRKTRVNDAAVVRGTDDPRSPISPRLTGQKVKSFAKSEHMGGGPGTPDMSPVTQNLPYRPWFFRSAGLPPKPDTMFGSMTSNEPLQRTPPVDAGEMVTASEIDQPVTLDDFTDQDYYA